MAIDDDVRVALANQLGAKSGDSSFTRLREFYAEMQRLGLVTRHEYDIPPLDTIGRRAVELSKSQTR